MIFLFRHAWPACIFRTKAQKYKHTAPTQRININITADKQTHCTNGWHGGEDVLYIVSTTGALCSCSCVTDLTVANTPTPELSLSVPNTNQSTIRQNRNLLFTEQFHGYCGSPEHIKTTQNVKVQMSADQIWYLGNQRWKSRQTLILHYENTLEILMSFQKVL